MPDALTGEFIACDGRGTTFSVVACIKLSFMEVRLVATGWITTMRGSNETGIRASCVLSGAQNSLSLLYPCIAFSEIAPDF
ncbi:hypothetical protein D8666_21605 [Ochrobactrum soli]|uniref:Uncharacterized protein n=1 Tax=Ochrobactrum soli TaxID=2448455 RepID=A0A849KKW7_9HYPH|nr:hypothetical protein [[Ochrobactrum] soli]NNU61023.1 hypothetical protein [[Ochrobactrum] soli]RLL65185.1 hypothetical protein D8666_21605 [[Ochrobactrum] soli]RRD22506.1 hypothetical protein ECB98_20190 [Brucellaceae bacterium VT-16-1752]